MVERPVFVSNVIDRQFVDTVTVEFKWFSGFSLNQKRKSINSLHSSAEKRIDNVRIIEISTKSQNELGIYLSSFNLLLKTKRTGKLISVESAFQGSKVFEFGGPYTDIYDMPSRESKRDERLRQSGKLIGFRFFGEDWPNHPMTAFYDWLYINTLNQDHNVHNSSLSIEYRAFTDIEFNPEKSINCQAHSLALFNSLTRRNLLTESISTRHSFLQMHREHVLPRDLRLI